MKAKAQGALLRNLRCLLKSEIIEGGSCPLPPGCPPLMYILHVTSCIFRNVVDYFCLLFLPPYPSYDMVCSGFTPLRLCVPVLFSVIVLTMAFLIQGSFSGLAFDEVSRSFMVSYRPSKFHSTTKHLVCH